MSRYKAAGIFGARAQALITRTYVLVIAYNVRYFPRPPRAFVRSRGGIVRGLTSVRSFGAALSMKRLLDVLSTRSAAPDSHHDSDAGTVQTSV